MIKAILLDVDNTLLDFNKCACGIKTCWYRHGSDKDGSLADYCVADLQEICGIL